MPWGLKILIEIKKSKCGHMEVNLTLTKPYLKSFVSSKSPAPPIQRKTGFIKQGKLYFKEVCLQVSSLQSLRYQTCSQIT